MSFSRSELKYRCILYMKRKGEQDQKRWILMLSSVSAGVSNASRAYTVTH